MASKRVAPRLAIVIRIFLILVVGAIGIHMGFRTPYWLIGCWLGALDLLLVFELIRVFERSQKAFREFLFFIKQGEFTSISILDEQNKEFQEAYSVLFEKFRNLRIEKETNYHYLKRIIEHVDSALICLKDDKDIQLINKTAQDLLQVAEIRELGALEKVNDELTQFIRNIRSGEREMIRFIRHGRIMKLSIRATEFTLDSEIYKIVSLQDIKSELEEQELDSWQKLVRVLTHEIMNSTIPITNMVSMAREILLDNRGKPKEIPGLSTEETCDLMASLYTAQTRSQGLSNFVQSTKSLSRIPEPSFGDTNVKELFKRLHEIFRSEIEKNNVRLNVSVDPPALMVEIDADLIEQVMINLIRNAIDALHRAVVPTIDLNASKTNEGGIIMSVCDNGHAISPENLDQIFVPFYSTKKEGSGIGLSLSMQIMKIHKGRIDVQSEVGKGTCVNLEF